MLCSTDGLPYWLVVPSASLHLFGWTFPLSLPAVFSSIWKHPHVLNEAIPLRSWRWWTHSFQQLFMQLLEKISPRWRWCWLPGDTASIWQSTQGSPCSRASTTRCQRSPADRKPIKGHGDNRVISKKSLKYISLSFLCLLNDLCILTLFLPFLLLLNFQKMMVQQSGTHGTFCMLAMMSEQMPCYHNLVFALTQAKTSIKLAESKTKQKH